MAGGSAPLAYQWLKNDLPIAGATNSAFGIDYVLPGDAGNYSVQVSNSTGMAFSTAARLTVLWQFSITTQPMSQTVKLGARTATFRADVASTFPVLYQWFKDGLIRPGSTNSSLTLTNIRSADAGAYSTVAFNILGAQQSTRAVLTVDSEVGPILFRHPASVSVAPGEPATFDVEVEGLIPLSFQWLKNSIPIPSATNALLAIEQAQAWDADGYAVIVTNQLGKVTSSLATLTILSPPAMLTQPADKFVGSGANIQLTVTATGSGPMQYQWYKNDLAIAGATNAALSLQRVQISDTGSYHAIVQNSFGTVISSAATVIVQEPPTITEQPVSQTVPAGVDVTLSVSAAGSLPLAFQWLKNGAAIGAATNPVFSISGVKLADSGSYTVTVTNGVAKVTSRAAVLKVGLSVLITSQPTNLALPLGLDAQFSVAAEGVPPLAFQWMKNGVALAGATNPTLVIPSIKQSDAGAFSASVSNDFGGITSAMGTLRVDPPVMITTPPKSQNLAIDSFVQLYVDVLGVTPFTFQWFKEGREITGATNARLTLITASMLDGGNYSVVVRNSLGAATSAVAQVTVTAPPAIVRDLSQMLGAAGQSISLSPEVTGSAPLRFQWFKNGAPIASATGPTLNLSNLQAHHSGAYYFSVTNSFGQATSQVANVSVIFPPVIVRQLADQFVARGSTVSLAVQTTGALPMTYRWFKDGHPLSTADGPDLRLGTAEPELSGHYGVTVQNHFGSAQSAASLTVTAPPEFDRHPSDQSATIGATISFEVAASGAQPMSAQWFKDGQPIPGETQFELMLSPVAISSAGTFHVVVTNRDGRAASAQATLQITFPSSIRADMNNDGLPDILFQHPDGRMGFWGMRDVDFISVDYLGPAGIADPQWRLIAGADFTQDGRQDLLLQRADGTLGIWALDGTQLLSAMTINSPFRPASAWTAVTAASFDGHDPPDIFLQHSRGLIGILSFNTTGESGAALLFPDPGESWKAVGAADFNRDGQDDLLLQHSDGTLMLWELNGGAVRSADFLRPRGHFDAAWRVVGVLDRNRDDAPDLLFQRSTDGALGIWLMQGTTLLEARSLIPIDSGSDWRAAGP